MLRFPYTAQGRTQLHSDNLNTHLEITAAARAVSLPLAEQWNAFLATRPDSNFYQRHEWLAINERNFGHQTFDLTIAENGTLRGVFPLVFIDSRLLGRILSSMPFVNFGGICADSLEIRERLLQKAIEICDQLKADYVEIRSLEPICDSLPTGLQKVSMTIELEDNADAQWETFNRRHRKAIRRVYQQGIEVRHGGLELLDDFYQLLATSWKALGTPIYRRSYFRDIIQTFASDVGIFVAYHQRQAIATGFVGYYGDTVEGMWAGALPDLRNLNPNYALYWEMIKHACDHGYRRFHLGRSTVNSGGEAFKRKWNAVGQQIYYQYHLGRQTSMPALNKENEKFHLAIKAWQHLPLGMTKLIGPLISKSIP